MDYVKKVIVDTREQKFGKKASAFFKKKGVFPVEASLADGDYLFVLNNNEELYIERKEIRDFCSSYIKKRIHDQALRLSEHDNSVLIIYGDNSLLRTVPILKNLTKNSVNKMIANISLNFGIPVIRVETEIDFLNTCLFCCEELIKGRTGFRKDRPENLGRTDINILTSLNGIGYKKAKLLLDEFKSPKAVLETSDEELLKINGVGKTLVERLRRLKSIYECGSE